MKLLKRIFSKKKTKESKKELLESYPPYESFRDNQLNILKQKQEDDRHYNHFEIYCLKRLSEQISNNNWKTKTAIIINENLKNYVTEYGLTEISEEYDKYMKDVFITKSQFYLTKEEFLIRKLNLWLCADFSDMIFNLPPMYGDNCYNIYDKSSARYIKGNIQEIMID